MPPSVYLSSGSATSSTCTKTGSDDVPLELECEHMPQQQQQMPQQLQMPQQHLNQNPAYGYWAPPSPLQTGTARLVVDYPYDSDHDSSCKVTSTTGSPSTASTRSSGSSRMRSTKHPAVPVPSVPSSPNMSNEDEREEYYRRQNQNQIQYYPEDVDANDDDDNVVLWDRPSWSLSSMLPPWKWCIPASTTRRGNGDNAGTPPTSTAALDQMTLHQRQQLFQQQQQQQQQQYNPYSTLPEYYYPHPPPTPYQQQQLQYSQFQQQLQLQQHHMFVQQQQQEQQQQLRGGMLGHGDEKSWSSGSGSSISSSTSDPSMEEDQAEWIASNPPLTPAPAGQQQWKTTSKTKSQDPPKASWNSGAASLVPKNNKDGTSFTNPSSPILAKPRLARRSNTTCAASTLSVSVSQSHKTITMTTTGTNSSPASLGRPPLLARRGVSAPGSLRIPTTTGTGSPGSPPQLPPPPPHQLQQQQQVPSPPPLQQRSPLQHHHPNLNYNNNNSNSKPPRSNSMTKTGSTSTSTSTSPDVVLANANTLTPPTRLRLDSRDSSTGSLHRRQTRHGSFEFSACSLSDILGHGHSGGPTPILTRNASSSSSSSTRPDFPTTIEYRAASTSYSTSHSLPVVSPIWARGSSWSSSWSEEPELDHHNDNDNDEESLWISEDEDEEHGGNVDANASTANASEHHAAAGEMERKRSLGYISPAEGESSSSSSSLSSSSSTGGQEKKKEEPQPPEHELQQVAPPNDWMLQWAQQGTTTTATTPSTTVESPAMVIDEDILTQEVETTVDTRPVYLPLPSQHHKTEDKAASNNKVILSGWVAVSADDSLLIKLAASDGRPTLVRSDLALLELTCDSLILRRRGTNQDVTVVPLSNDCQVSAREISSRAGKCVVISKSSKTVCTILPVSLPRQLFAATGDELVEKDRFDRLQSCMFTPFCVATPTLLSKSKSKPAPARRTATCDLQWGQQEYCVRHYAPNEQHDMARHLQFAIDSAIRMS
jgi:hypothetical protein